MKTVQKVLMFMVGVAVCGSPITLAAISDHVFLIEISTGYDYDDPSDPHDLSHEFFLEVTWGNTTALEQAITLLIADRETLSFGEIQETVARSGFAVPQEQLEKAIAGLRLYSIILKEGQHYRFASRAFAGVVRESQETDILLTTLRNEMREQSERGDWRLY